MRDILQQIRQANVGGLYYVALFSALALPDVCGALDSPDGRATKTRYISWFDAHVTPRYETARGPTLTGTDAHYFRCSMLHQGRTGHPASKFSRILFLEPGTSNVVLHNNVFNDALNIDVRIFVQDILAAAEAWLAAAEVTTTFQTNIRHFVTRYPSGLPPYIVGVPVIS